ISAAGSAKSWADVEITFVREDLIRIHVGNHVETKDAIQMGLADGRSPERKKYKSAWHIMRIMSQADGVLHDGHIQGKKWPTIYKHVTSLRERLQQFFGIAED